MIIPGQGSGRATTTTQLKAGGRNGISYVHGHAVPLGVAAIWAPDHRVFDFA